MVENIEFRQVVYIGPITDDNLRTELMQFLGHKGEPWMTDIQKRLNEPGNLFCVTMYLEKVVAHVWIGYDPKASSPIGLLGHVFTHPDFRGKGLATKLI